MRRLRDIVGLVLLSHGLNMLQPRTAVAISLPATSVSVVSRDDGDFLTVAVERVPLRRLLTEIAARAGFQFVELVPTERWVSVALHDVPLDQALKRILHGEQLDFLLVYQDGKSAKLRRVLVVESRSRDMTSPQDAKPSEREAERDESGVEDPKVFGPDARLEQILDWTIHPDPTIRTAALEALALYPADHRARLRLMDSVKDADASVRSLAIGLLGPLLVQWPEAQDVVMEALGDHEPSVRRLALLALWETSSAHIAEALKLGLRDHTPEIREQAKKFVDELSIMQGAPER